MGPLVESVVEDKLLVADGILVAVLAGERCPPGGAEDAAGGGEGCRAERGGGGWRGEEEVLEETGQRGSLGGDSESQGCLHGKAAARYIIII
jgi:hypothetical protein